MAVRVAIGVPLAAVGIAYVLWRKLSPKSSSPSPDADLEVPYSQLDRLRDVPDREGVAIVTGTMDNGYINQPVAHRETGEHDSGWTLVPSGERAHVHVRAYAYAYA